jgi:hypothetical protein
VPALCSGDDDTMDDPSVRRVLVGISGAVLVLAGLCLTVADLGMLVLAAYVGVDVAIFAAIAIGLLAFGLLCLSWGIDLVFRAISGRAPSARWAGRLGVFRIITSVTGTSVCLYFFGLALLSAFFDLQPTALYSWGFNVVLGLASICVASIGGFIFVRALRQ